jgi:hypothetical protein
MESEINAEASNKQIAYFSMEIVLDENPPPRNARQFAIVAKRKFARGAKIRT